MRKLQEITYVAQSQAGKFLAWTGKIEILVIPNPLWSGRGLEREHKNSKPRCVIFLPVTALLGSFIWITESVLSQFQKLV